MLEIWLLTNFSRTASYPPDILNLICDYIQIQIKFHVQYHSYNTFLNENKNIFSQRSSEMFGGMGISQDATATCTIGMSHLPLQSVYAEHIKYVSNLHGKRRVKGYQLRVAANDHFVARRRNREKARMYRSDSVEAQNKDGNGELFCFQFGVTTSTPQELQKDTQFTIQFYYSFHFLFFSFFCILYIFFFMCFAIYRGPSNLYDFLFFFILFFFLSPCFFCMFACPHK